MRVPAHQPQLVGVEGEVAGSFGIEQSLDQCGDLTADEKPPNMLSYSGNLVDWAPGRSVVPYASGGIGGLIVYDCGILGINNTATL